VASRPNTRARGKRIEYRPRVDAFSDARSIEDRRHFEQVDRLTEAYDAVVLIVEGEPIHIAQASWKGALARVLLSGAAVIATTDAVDTAEWLSRPAVQHVGHTAEREGPTDAGQTPIDPSRYF
jgi:ERCC4-type nuclease